SAAKPQVSGYSGAEYQAFSNLREAIEWSEVPFRQLPPWAINALGGGSIVGAEMEGEPPPPYHSTNPSELASAPIQSTPSSSSHHTTSQDLSDTSTSDDEYGLENVTMEDILAAEAGISSHPLRGVGSGSQETNADAQVDNTEVPSSRQDRREAAIAPPLAVDHAIITVGQADPILTQPNDRQSPGTSRHNWTEDSILSGIYQAPASGPPTAEDHHTYTEDANSGSTAIDNGGEGENGYADPNQSDGTLNPPFTFTLPETLLGAPDANPLNHRIHLRGASTTVAEYSPVLHLLIGRQAVKYLHMHYYTAGSTLSIINALSHYANNGPAFIRYLIRRDMAPRHAGYLWTLLAPEISLANLGFGNSGEAEGDEGDDDDQDMSFVYAASEPSGSSDGTGLNENR
ncbi:hypothetical protein FRC01_014324, partial [Tulasnella sp. 417]